MKIPLIFSATKIKRRSERTLPFTTESCARLTGPGGVAEAEHNRMVTEMTEYLSSPRIRIHHGISEI